MTESELAGYARMSLSALHKLLDRMEAKQLVAREADEQDARRVIVRAGPRAKKLSHLINFYQEINEVALHGLNRKERENLVQLLEKVVDNLEKETRSPGSGR